MKEKTFLKISLSILIIIFSFLIIITTYSKYITQSEDSASLHIANWNIKLNDKDITESKNFTSNIQLIPDKNEYIEENVIAPTSSGSFKLKLESTGTELPFRYDLSVTHNSETVSNSNTINSTDIVLLDTSVDLPDFKITAYTKNGSDIIPVEPSTTFSEIVTPPVDINGKFTGEEVINDYTFYFEWYDKEDNVLDNQDDVNVSKSDSSVRPTASIPLSLKITQIENE